MQQSTIRRSEDEVRPKPPIITIILLMLCVFGYYEFASNPHWLEAHAFSVAKFDTLFAQHDWIGLSSLIFWATFAHASLYQLVGSVYFLWVFGWIVEERLGDMSYLLLVVLSMGGGWLFMSYDTGAISAPYFIGPSILTVGVIGAYMIFFPEKKLPGVVPMPKYSYRIFKRKRDENPAEAYGVDPWVVIGGFIIYQVVMHFVMKTQLPGYDLMRPLAAMGTFLVGFALALSLVVHATKSAEGNPLRSLAWLKYQQLRNTDLNHEQALRGSARLLSIPEEQVREWIGSGTRPPAKLK